MKKADGWMLFAAVLLAPLAAMLYLYQRNTQYLMFTQVLWVCLGMLVVSCVGFGVLRLVFRSAMGAALGCFAAWILFFAFPTVADKMKMIYAKKLLIYGSVALVLILITAFLGRIIRKPLGGFALALTGLLFLMNAAPSVYYAVSQNNAMYQGSDYKTEFTVDDKTPTPNVYWIHTDGMLGFDAMELYFGDAQEEFSSALEERGFSVNRGAFLETAHATAIAIPSLMCPYFYDTQLKDEFAQFATTRKFSYNIALLKRNLRYARTKNEMLAAFKARGYETNVIGTIGTYFPLSVDKFYFLPNDTLYSISSTTEPCIVRLNDYSDEKYLNIVESYELASLLTDVSDGYYDMLFRLSASGKLPIGLAKEELQARPDNLTELMCGGEDARYFSITMEELFDSVQTGSSPRLTVVMDMLAHTPFKLDENGEATGENGLTLGEYPGQHAYAAKVLVNMLDVILAKDPDAVIVLQADHGLHQQTQEEIEAAFGEGSEITIWNQVVSAIRVPEKYQNADVRYAQEEPLDIARWLVNTFVGDNYDYIEETQA